LKGVLSLDENLGLSMRDLHAASFEDCETAQQSSFCHSSYRLHAIEKKRDS